MTAIFPYKALKKPVRFCNGGCCVLCEVQTKPLYVTQVTTACLRRVMAQAVSRRPVTTDVPVRSLVSPCEICGRQGGTVTGLSPSTLVSSVTMVPPVLRNHHLLTVIVKRTSWP